MPALDTPIAQRLLTLQTECRRHQFEEQADRLAQRQRDLDAPLLIMVVGEGNFGKSTLLNALVGKTVAPVSRLPKTWKVDFYESANGQAEEAWLYWRSNPDQLQRMSVAEAGAICDQEENLADLHFKNGQSWKSDLFQVRWRLEAPWPKANVALVDTPGFSQLRADTSVQNLNLYGSQGIQFAASDAFEYYYYRADVVLWCIKATKLQDEDTLTALRAVGSQEKILVGVLTHMDRVPQERWEEIRQEALRLYGEYVPEFIFTAAGAKNELKEQTITALRVLLQERFLNSAATIKRRVMNSYYGEEASTFAQSLDGIMACYLDNCKTRSKLLNLSTAIVSKHIRTAATQIEVTWNAASNRASRRLPTLWDQAGGDVRDFGRIAAADALDLKSVQGKIDQTLTATIHGIDAEVLSRLEDTEWRGVRLGSHRSEIVAVTHQPAVLAKTSTFTTGSLGTTIAAQQSAAEQQARMATAQDAKWIKEKPLEALLVAPFMVAFELFDWISGSRARREREQAIKVVYEGIDEFCKSNIASISGKLEPIRGTVQTQMEGLIEGSFFDYHGKGIPQLLDHALEADISLNRVGQHAANRETVGLVGGKVTTQRPLSWYYYPLLKYGSKEAKRRWDEAVFEEWRAELARVLEPTLVETGAFSTADLEVLREKHQEAVKNYILQAVKSAPWRDAARGISLDGGKILSVAGVELCLLQSVPLLDTAISSADLERLDALPCFSALSVKPIISKHYETTLKQLVMRQVAMSPEVSFRLNRFGWQTAVCAVALGCGIAMQMHWLPLVATASYRLMAIGGVSFVASLTAYLKSYRRLNEEAERTAAKLLEELFKRLQAEMRRSARSGLGFRL